MEINQQEITKIINKDKKTTLKFNEQFEQYNSFKLKANVECLIQTSNPEVLRNIYLYAKQNNIRFEILGNGTNILVTSDIKGIVCIYTNNNIEQLEDGLSFSVSSGIKMSELGFYLAKQGVSGFERLTTIPGNLSGAIFMNAGCYGLEISSLLKQVTYLDEKGEVKVLNIDEPSKYFSYRDSYFKRFNCVNASCNGFSNHYIILSCILKLESFKDEKQITSDILEYLAKRKQSQPIEYPNAGSFFKRADNVIVSKLIDEAGLKGTRVGDAMVSTKHAGFIVNVGNATAKDILELGEYVQKDILEKYNVKIEMEIQKL